MPHKIWGIYFKIKEYHYSRFLLPSIRDSRKKTIKTKNNTFAIPAALAAIPVKPSIPAMMATTRKITVQRNIILYFKRWIISNNDFTKHAKEKMYLTYAEGIYHPRYRRIVFFLMNKEMDVQVSDTTKLQKVLQPVIKYN